VLALLFGSAVSFGLAAEPPARIVSLVPAVTEMLFVIGAGPRVVGVSSFDRYPPEVATRARVGALLDPDVERILSLRPDLVVLHASQEDLQSQLKRAGVPLFAYSHGGLDNVARTMRALGARTGTAAAADRAAGSLEQRLARLRGRTAGRPRPRTLLVFGRERFGLRNIYASGGVGFLHDMLEVGGAVNVFGDAKRESVQATTEAILARAPEVIVELHYSGSLDRERLQRERQAWQALSAVPAVRGGRLYLLVGDEFVVPGPRIVSAAERLARVLHPELF
jgi:iron complex transport system substrate-binding protein